MKNTWQELTALALGAALGLAVAGVPAPAAAQTHLILTTMSPGGSARSNQLFRPWAKRMNEAGGGAIEVDPRDGFAVANFRNIFDRVMNDVVQIGWAMQGNIGGRFPLTEVATFPFQAKDTVSGSVALWRLYASGALASDYTDVKPLVLGVFPPNALHYRTRPKSIADFAGMKLRAASKPQAELITHLGGTPVTMPAEDLVSALQRGLIDATFQGWTIFGTMRLDDATKYHVDAGFGTSTIMLFMAMKKWVSLSAKAQKAISSQSGEAMSRMWGEHYDTQAAAMRKKVLAEPGQVDVSPTDAQLDVWRKRVQPVEEEWIKKTPHGAELMAKYRALVAQVEAGK